MPLVAPFTTQGGPANPEHADWFHRWWEVCRGLDGSDLLQGQMHKTELLVFGIGNLFTDVRKRREEVLRENGNWHTEPYRVVVRYGPEFLCRTACYLPGAARCMPASTYADRPPAQRPVPPGAHWGVKTQSRRPTPSPRFGRTGRAC